MSKQREREALELALDALDKYAFSSFIKESDWRDFQKVMGTLREALAEPEQEQVAWFKGLPKGTTHIATLTATVNCGGRIETMTRAFKYENADLLVYYTDSDNECPEWVKAKSIYPQWDFSTVMVPLYTTPPARKPLTDDEINALELPPSGCNFRDIVRVIERAHGIGEP